MSATCAGAEILAPIGHDKRLNWLLRCDMNRTVTDASTACQDFATWFHWQLPHPRKWTSGRPFPIEVLALDAGTDRLYADVRAVLEEAGRPISANDLLIAAHALANDCVLVTHNRPEFERVPDLEIEN